MKITLSKDEQAEVKRNSRIMLDISKAIQEIEYGSVQIHIQDGKVVQIDKVNKVRMC